MHDSRLKSLREREHGEKGGSSSSSGRLLTGHTITLDQLALWADRPTPHPRKDRDLEERLRPVFGCKPLPSVDAGRPLKTVFPPQRLRRFWSHGFELGRTCFEWIEEMEGFKALHIDDLPIHEIPALPLANSLHQA